VRYLTVPDYVKCEFMLHPNISGFEVCVFNKKKNSPTFFYPYYNFAKY